MADCGPCKNVFSHDSPYDNHDDDGEKAEEESGNEDELEESRREFVPVISYISPSLARLVSPLSVMTRQEVKSSTTAKGEVLIFPIIQVVSTGRAPRHSSTPRVSTGDLTPRSAPKRKAEPDSGGRATLPRFELKKNKLQTCFCCWSVGWCKKSLWGNPRELL